MRVPETTGAGVLTLIPREVNAQKARARGRRALTVQGECSHTVYGRRATVCNRTVYGRRATVCNRTFYGRRATVCNRTV